jgi:tetratricopeptide (TPR) repeat protein
MTSTRWPGLGRSRIWAAAFVGLHFCVVLTCSALALDRKDFDDCEGSSDVPRMIKACTAIADDQRVPAGARSMALLKRGFGNFALDDMDAAIADFNAAIALNPENSYAHHELGLALAKTGDVDGALTALDEAVKLNPQSAVSHHMRGNMLALHGRMDEAIADYNAAIALGADKNTVFTDKGQVDRPAADRVEAGYFVARADALYLTGKFADAVADYDRAKAFPDREGYNLIWSTLARISLGSPHATEALAAALDSGAVTGWPKVVAELIVGRTTAAAALAAAKNDDQACEAHFYSGVISLSGKDTAAAKRQLSTARDSCPKSFREHRGAVALLKGLER